MATLTSIRSQVLVEETIAGQNRGLGQNSLRDHRSDGRRVLPESYHHYYTGMFMALAGVTMLFAAFTSAYIVRQGLSDDWQSATIPGILWPNTLILVASSLTLERARKLSKNQHRFSHWWMATVGLGIIFLLGQFWAWRQLTLNGIYLSSNPSSSFFYLLTATHGVHLLGGLAGLQLVCWRVWQGNHAAPRSTILGVTALYWHFMSGLWVYIFLLFLIWG